MREVTPSPVKAVLGPTNTGKTHLAVERMVAHSSGLMGFPLRLLAREVYDRVVKLKGPNEVALITGEEKIVPPQARWFLCTAESMPIRGKEQSELQRDFAFVAVDEAQLGADPERGHVFTDRLLNARGREETMILGSESLAPMVRSLLPKAEIVRRPRFSTLSYAGAAKLSRLPPRSAIVAFSADQVYAVAEALRRLRGGAAVVMGALSPRTRNAQVDMYQAGERRDRHGPQHGRGPCRLRRARQVRRPAPAAADPRGNGADRRPRGTAPARRHVRHAQYRRRGVGRVPPRRD
jgi:ATP-dependent RNA helicase SUPV3L1/SUV3